MAALQHQPGSAGARRNHPQVPDQQLNGPIRVAPGQRNSQAIQRPQGPSIQKPNNSRGGGTGGAGDIAFIDLTTQTHLQHQQQQQQHQHQHQHQHQQNHLHQLQQQHFQQQQLHQQLQLHQQQQQQQQQHQSQNNQNTQRASKTPNLGGIASSSFISQNEVLNARGASGHGGSGNVVAQGPPDPLPPAKATILNSRHKWRLGFSAQAPEASSAAPPMTFVSPSTIQPASRGPGTPIVPRGASGTRQKQFKPQSSKPVATPQQGSKRDTRPKPYMLEAPSIAPVYPNKKYSDFFPWKGNHPEDQVTDVHAKNGQFDRTQLFGGKGVTEHTPAHGNLSHSLRQKNNLQTLSSLFLSVLEKRQNYSRISTPTAFKPPPRVTLADHKRETWLRDLANPAVQLRRLSRTIPHGVRGKSLLEQCSSKSVPPTRAIWFVRCVGANELRGLKRKGASSLAFGNEARWIKDWTGQVTQFIDKSISECGTTADASWKKKMIYALRLSAQLYSEHLVDRTTFLDWYLALLESPNLDILPLSLLISSIYWKDLLRIRRTGHRFTEALLGKAQMILDSDAVDLYAPLLQKLSTLITEILTLHQESLIIPQTWPLYQSTLEKCVNRKDPLVETCLQNVIHRNNSLSLNPKSKTAGPTISSQRLVIDILDSASIPYDLDTLTKSCIDIMPDHSQFVQCLCEWAVTSLRVGLYRIYLAAAVLRQEAKAGVVLQEPIMAFLERFSTAPGSKSHVYLLISELVRADRFSLTQYMRWLISRGILNPFTSMEKEHPCHVRLLAELPFAGATHHARNLRNSLLSRVGFSIDDEAQILADAKKLIASRLGGLLSDDIPPPGPSLKFAVQELEYLRGMSRNQMTDIALWIRASVKKHVVEGAPVGPNNWRDLTVEVGITAITLQQFLLVRKVLEEFEDYGILSEVLKVASSSDNSGVLSSIADTVSYNIEVFSVLNSVNDILQLLYHRYKKLQLRRPIEKYVVASFLDLASFPGCNEEIRKQLEHDISTGYPLAPFAHSPVSDNEFLNVMQDGTADFNEEMDRLLQNGSSIDKQTLTRIFETIVSRTESFLGDSAAYNRFSFVSLMKLRQFDPTNFDVLMDGWVHRLFLNIFGRPPLLHTFAVLIAGSCITLEAIVKAALELLKGPSNGTKLSKSLAPELAAQVLELIVGEAFDGCHLTDQEIYSLKRKRQSFERNHPMVLVEIIYRSIELCAAEGSFDLDNRIRGLILSKPIIHQLRSLSTSQPDLLRENLLDPLSKNSQPALLKWLRLLIDHLLDDHDSSDLTDADADVQVSRLLQLANDFSIRLCQLKMRIIFDGQRGGSPSSNTHITQTFFRGIASDFKQKAGIWSDLVSVLDENCARQIRSHAEELFLQSMTFPVPADMNEGNESLARALLAIIEATSAASTRPATGSGMSISAALVEKLNMLVQYVMPPLEEGSGSGGVAAPIAASAGGVSSGSSSSITGGSSSGAGGSGGAQAKDYVAELRSWLVLFLRIIVLHRAAFSSISRVGISDQARIVVGLCGLLQSEHLQSDEALFDHVLDVTCLFIDDTSDDSRHAIRRFFRNKSPIPHFIYLLGSSDCPTTDSWLKAVRGNAGKTLDFPVKSWELLADPTPVMGENDTSLSLMMFRTRRTKCNRGEGGKG